MIQVCVPKVLRQVVDEEVASLGALLLGRRWLRGLWLLDSCTKHAAVWVRRGAILLEGRIGLQGTGEDTRSVRIESAQEIQHMHAASPN